MKRPIWFVLTLCVFVLGPSLPVHAEKIYPDMALALDAGAKVLVREYKSQKAAKAVKTIAVLPLVNENGNTSNLGVSIADGLQTRIFSKTLFRIIERQRIDSLLEEHEMLQSGLVDSDFIKQVGKLSGAELALIGTIYPNGEAMRLNIRIVSVENGELLSTTEVSFQANDTTKKKYEDIVELNRGKLDGVYRIEIGSVDVTKSKTWDYSGEPDIYVEVYAGDRLLLKTDYKTDSYRVDFQSSQQGILKENDIIKILVFDEDIAANDFIGKIELTPADIKKILSSDGYYSLTSENIEELKIKITKN